MAGNQVEYFNEWGDGFVWSPGRVRHSVSFLYPDEEAYYDDYLDEYVGNSEYRLYSRFTIVEGITDSAAAIEVVNDLGRVAMFYTCHFDPEFGTLTAEASTTVLEQNWWVTATIVETLPVMVRFVDSVAPACAERTGGTVVTEVSSSQPLPPEPGGSATAAGARKLADVEKVLGQPVRNRAAEKSRMYGDSDLPERVGQADLADDGGFRIDYPMSNFSPSKYDGCVSGFVVRPVAHTVFGPGLEMVVCPGIRYPAGPPDLNTGALGQLNWGNEPDQEGNTGLSWPGTGFTDGERVFDRVFVPEWILSGLAQQDGADLVTMLGEEIANQIGFGRALFLDGNAAKFGAVPCDDPVLDGFTAAEFEAWERLRSE